jgi:18S rRNA (adenine1779-N6/adenine1780-N6)-dimethyltransferase
MPKSAPKKRNSASQASPYAKAVAKTKAVNSIFRMNTDIGQHVLKNPGVAQAIVDKADLKQSDVRIILCFPSRTIKGLTPCCLATDCPRSWSWYR